MQEVTFDIEAITPLFLAGADQMAAELRAPSFRGEMRYWLRALIGGLAGTDGEGLTKVRNIETDLFGATDKGSALQIRVLGSPTRLEEFRRESRGRDVTGRDYLFWSMEQFRDKPRRRYFPQGTKFQVMLSTRDQDDIHLKQGLAAFWLLTHLGGIGSRSRRCAGSLHATGGSTILPFGTSETPQSLEDQLTRGIRAARNLYTLQGTLQVSSVRDALFDVLSQATCSIWILSKPDHTWHSANEAIQHIGESLQDYRSTIKPLWRRKIFGLPLKDVDMRARRASPLLLRVTRLQREQFVGIAVLFKTIGEGISISDYTLVEKWIAQDFPKALKVTL